MQRVVVKTKIGSDGFLHLELPQAANTEVQVTVEPARRLPLTQAEWEQFVERTAGSIDDPEFRRWEQGEFEQREPLS